MLRSWHGSLIAAVTLLALSAAPAQAEDSLAVTVGSDPTEEVPVAVSVTWSSTNPSARVRVTSKPAGGVTCAANYAADSPNSDDVIYDFGPASGTTSANQTYAEPGQYILCGYLQDGNDSPPLKATGPIVVTVRPARATVALSVPARVDPNQTFPVAAVVNAELRRDLFVTVKRAGGRACEPNYAADDAVSADVIFSDNDVQGALTVTRNATASETRGVYLLCAYVQEDSRDASPEATGSAQFTVGLDPCATARSALTTAKRKLRSAKASVTRNRRAIARYTVAARRGSQARRRHNRALLTVARKRLRAAQVRRVNASRSVAKRTTAVARACG